MESPPFKSTRRSTRELRAAIFAEAAAFVRANLSEQITAEEVARRTATSPRQLRRAFSEVGRTSFRSYLAEARMERARELLTSTDLPVYQVARRVGYRQPGQFAKAFKRAHHVSPSQFRASHGRSARPR